MRRSVAAANVLGAPRPGAWTVAKATEWLVANPIVAAAEVDFIKSTIAHRIAVAVRIQQQPVAPTVPPAASRGSNWVGKLPHLRLIHAIIDDVRIFHCQFLFHLMPSVTLCLQPLKKSRSSGMK
jgi:hypothetical protein